MTIRFYLLPVDRQVINGTAYRGPQYFAWRFNPTGLTDPWSWYDYGSMDWGVLCSDISDADHTALVANAAKIFNVSIIPTTIPISISTSWSRPMVKSARIATGFWTIRWTRSRRSSRRLSSGLPPGTVQ